MGFSMCFFVFFFPPQLNVTLDDLNGDRFNFMKLLMAPCQSEFQNKQDKQMDAARNVSSKEANRDLIKSEVENQQSSPPFPLETN